MKYIKNLFTITFLVLGVHSMTADHGSFGGAFGGAFVGSTLSNAFAPRTNTVVVQSVPVQKKTSSKKRKRTLNYDDLSDNQQKIVTIFDELTDDEQIDVIKYARKKSKA